MVGQSVSHYRILERVGAGGMGVVYKAEDTRLRRTVALKFLPLDLTQDPEARARLYAEAQTASALDHPNICTIHEIDETPDGQVFVAMSYYEGETLKERLSRGPLPVADAVRIATECARAVGAAHEAGVIHRDIKPANIMITRRGDVRLLDFGVAKLAGRTALTRTGVTFGTIAYMAPEHITGHLTDPQTDVWALGVVLYEMVARRQPFEGEHEVAVIDAIANRTPAPLRQARPEAPAELESIVTHALQKKREARYASAADMLRDLERLSAAFAAAPTGPIVSPRARRRRPGIGIAAGVAALALVSSGLWWWVQAGRVQAAREALPRLRTLVGEEKFSAAFRLMQSIEPHLAGDAAYETERHDLFLPTSIRTDPEGAEIYVKGYDEPDAEWLRLGQSPLESRGPIGYFRWRVVKPGFVTSETASQFGANELAITLSPDGTVPEGMVPVPAGSATMAGAGTVPLEAFFIDQYEVTNRQFKAFLDDDGYTTREYWSEPFTEEGRPLTWEEGMTRLRDATGRPGPAEWELSTYPEGQDDRPVSGVSWYEALAYAAWAGRELPTVHHWLRAAPGGIFSNILEFSNFSNQDAAPVGTYPGLGEFGTYDMAGNVREWCWNLLNGRRAILGGAWNQPNYTYRNLDALDPFDRSSTNGFRTIARASADAVPPSLLSPITAIARDYSLETPVPDREFEIFRRMYEYDAADLSAMVESTDDSDANWRVERVSYAAAYGGERIVAYLFLPRRSTPPYQTVVYFPHSGGTLLRSFEKSEMNYLGFVVQAGRALMFPMYKGTYERRLGSPPDGPNAVRDLATAMIKDLQRSVDYLETRADIDADRLAYFGVSLGARLGNIALAIEPRFATAVLWSGGFRTSVVPSLPEVDEFNFASRVKTPVLMLNGREDFNYPVEASQDVMFRLLGTPSEDKKHVIYEGGHVFPFARVIKDTLDWLDTYLGVPR